MKKLFTLTLFVIYCVCSGQITQTYYYNGTVQNFTVPACVSEMTVELRGAQGGDAAYAGGNGGSVSGVISVTPGQIYNLFIGGKGAVTSGGYNGGGAGGGTPALYYGAGGGGATDMTFGGTSLTNRIMVAAGGGGSGGNTSYAPYPGVGGGGSFCNSPYGYGGQGGSGCAIGGDGSCSGGTAPDYGTGGAGGGLSGAGQASGGYTNIVQGVYGTAGGLGSGGIGGNHTGLNGGGGGGAGLYGGAGGMSGYGGCNGGGGGGSSYANDALFSSITFTAGNQTGNGVAIISYFLFMPPNGVTTTVTCAGSPITLAAGAASGYTWSTGSNNQTVSVAPVATTNYSVKSVNGLGCVTSTLHQVVAKALPNILINGGSSVINLGSGSTTLSSGNPIVFTFSDPLPANARLKSTILELDAVDQGWGSTGAGLGTYLSGDFIADPILGHTSQHYIITQTGNFPGYVKNGTNNVSMYFVSFPGWQAFVSSASITLIYDTGTLTTCAGGSVNLNASGASSYTWSGGITNNVAFVPTASVIRTVSATGSNGCFNSSTVSLVVNPLPTITVAGVNTVCSGNSVVQTASGANNYLWTNGSTLNNISLVALNTVTYGVTGTNTLTSCSSSITRTLLVSATPTITVPNYSLCNGNNITLSPSGAFTYTYSSGSAVVSPAASTSYSISGTSTAGCISASPAISTVTVHARPVITVNSGSICAGNSFLIIPGGALTYTITGNVFNVTPPSTTSYSISGTSTAGCTSTASAITEVTVRPRPVITSVSGSVCAGKSYTIIPGGASTYTITGNNYTVTPASTTSYSITGTSSLGCTSSNTSVITVTVNAIPVISANSGTMCSGKNFTIIPTGGSTYTITGNNFTVSPASNTSYSVTGTSSAGCISNNTAVVTVTVHALPVISVNSGSICEGSSILITPTGAQTYTIPGNVFNVSPTTNTSYAITGTSSLGCLAAAPAIADITVHARPVVTVNSGTICFGDSFTITPSGTSSYAITGNNFVVNPGQTTSYSVTGTSNVGCPSSNTAVANVTVYTLPQVASNSGTICNGNSFVIVPNGGATYSITGNSFTVSPSSTTSYSVTGISQYGCKATNTAVSTVTVYTLPVISVNSGSICSGSNFSIIPSGAKTYSITGNIFNVSPSVTTNYSVTGTSSLGCLSASAAVTEITVHARPVITAADGTICGGGSFTITPAGANSYTITGGSFSVAPATTNSYAVTGTSTAGCVSSSATPVHVYVNQLPVVTAKTTDPEICLGDAVTLSASGASTYTWNNSVVNNQSFVPVSTFSYSVTGTDVNGCSASASIAVKVNSLPVLSVNASPPSCPGETGTLTVNGAVTYTWSNGEMAPSTTVIPVVETTYTVVATDLKGCQSTAAVTRSLTVCFASIVTNTIISNVSCKDKNDATVRFETQVNYPLHEVRYEWDSIFCPNHNCAMVDSLAGGNYNVIRIVTYTVNSNYVVTDTTAGSVDVTDVNGPCELQVFNGITPNGDGINDSWVIVNIDEFPNNRVTIYTRWGSPVFETKGYDNRTNYWPNRDDISKLSSSTYFYIIEPGDGRAAVKGWVEVMKNE